VQVFVHCTGSKAGYNPLKDQVLTLQGGKQKITTLSFGGKNVEE